MTTSAVADIGRDGEACDQSGATRAPHARRKMPVRRRALAVRRLRLRRELPLRSCRRATGSAFKPFAGIARDKLRITGGADHLMMFGDDIGHDARCQGVRLAALLGGARRRLRPRRHGYAGRRSGHPPEQAHLRRLEGAVVHHHRRSAAIRRACGRSRIRRRPGIVTACLRPARASGRARSLFQRRRLAHRPRARSAPPPSAAEACDA